MSILAAIMWLLFACAAIAALGAALSLAILIISVARGVVEDRMVEVETEPTYPTTRYTIYQGGDTDG